MGGGLFELRTTLLVSVRGIGLSGVLVLELEPLLVGGLYCSLAKRMFVRAIYAGRFAPFGMQALLKQGRS